MDGERFLFSLSRFGVKLGLGPTEAFSRILGNPQDSFRSILVAGSNGKGSTTTFMYRIFRKKYITGLYTSPHLRRFSERIIVDDEEIPSSYIEEFVKGHDSVIDYRGERTQLTFFEYTTNMAFDYFRKKGIQLASVEVGMGGRMDSTNILKPDVSVITSISLEHTDKLGGTIEGIAREKGGIIKKGRPLVLGKTPEAARSLLLHIARENNSPVRETIDCPITNLNFSLSGTKFSLETENETYDVSLKALGEHQVQNSISTILAIESMKIDLGKTEILQGLQEKQIPGRFEIRRKNPFFILDGAHNSEASRILVGNITRYRIKDPLIMLGVLKDKNTYNVLQNLSQISDRILLTEPNEPERKKKCEELKSEAKFFFKDIEIRKRPSDALNLAIESGSNVVATGSFYLVGEIEKLLDIREGANGVPVEGMDSNGDSGPAD